MNRIVQFLAFSGGALLLAPSLTSAQWVPIDCQERARELRQVRERAEIDEDFRREWARYEASVRTAAPGDPDFVPHPYPRKPDEIFEDFRHAFESRLGVDPLRPAPRHRATLEALEDGKTSFEVVRVENWTPTRCRAEHSAPFYHLVRIFSPSGQEVARATLHESGLLASFADLGSKQYPLDDPETLAKSIEDRFSVRTEPRQVQFVTVDGLPMPCSPITPCTAFVSGGKVYLANHDFYLFSISDDAPAMGVLELAARPVGRPGAPLSASHPDRPWITVGFGMRQGELVAIGPRGRPLQ